MTIGGLWHGAGWTFIAWGALNGVLLAINHRWRQWRGTGAADAGKTFLSWLATFIAFAIGMVFFRAADMPSAILLLKTWRASTPPQPAAAIILHWDIWGIRRGYLSEEFIRHVFGSTWSVVGSVWTLGALAVALLLPETIEWMDYREGEPHSAGAARRRNTPGGHRRPGSCWRSRCSSACSTRSIASANSCTTSSEISMRLIAKFYALTLIAVSFALFAAVVAANVLIDPQRMFGPSCSPISATRTCATRNISPIATREPNIGGLMFASSRGSGSTLDVLSRAHRRRALRRLHAGATG